MMPSAMWRICAAHQLPTARELDLARCGLMTPRILKLWHALQQLPQQIINAVPQPADTSRWGSRSVERALGASYGATGWACKAEDHEADLQALSSARRSRRRSLSGSGGCHVFPYVKKS